MNLSAPRRRSGAIAAAVLATAAAAVLVVAATHLQNDSPVSLIGASQEAPPAPEPTIYVSRTDPGPVEVREVATGKVLRTLDGPYDPYLDNTLTVDRGQVSWLRLDEPAQRFDIVQESLDGGAQTLLPDGQRPLHSPDGRRLLHGLAGRTSVLDERTGHETRLPDLPGNGYGPTVWLPGGTQLLRVLSPPIDPATVKGCPPPFPGDPVCVYPTPAPRTSSAYRLDVTVADPTWQPVAAVQDSPVWGPYVVLGPAEGPDQVRAVEAGRDGTAESLLVLDVTDGKVRSREPVPAGYRLFTLDASGQHALIGRDDGIYAWTPGAPARRIGPSALQAAW